MSACPNCGKPVDQLRSRNVSVRAGKVVAYCSAECQAAQETKPTAVPKRAMPTMESGPVIEIIHEPVSGVVTSAPDRRDASSPAVSTPSSSASGASGTKKKKTRPSEPVLKVEDPAPAAAAEPKKKRASSEPADEWAKNAEMIQQDVASRVDKPRKGLVTALFIVVVAGIAAFVAYKFIFVKKATSAVTSPPPPVAKVEPAPPPPAPLPPAPPAITVPEAIDRAKVAIAKNLRAESPRTQRAAAAALERGGDRASAELLAAALKNETSDVTRLQVAYWLARGGDVRGTTALNQGFVGAQNKDTQRWAAEHIVRLAIGADPKVDVTKAADVLAASLEVPQNRLLSGELLARIDDLRGAIALNKIRGDAAATPEAKAQAAIALGLSGHPDIAPALHELLGNGSERPLAAAALAHLHDATAREVLVEQLATPTQRVRAARALRELEPKLDPIPLLPPLLDALAKTKDAEQVEVGEAILVLCGPAAWSTRE